MLTYGDLKPGDWVQWIDSGGVPHPVKRVSRKGFSVQNQNGALLEYRWSNGQYKYKYARKVKMEVRAPDVWQAGDMAYCIDGGGSISVGDILKVTEVSGPSEVIVSGVTKTRASLIKFGPGRPGGFVGGNRFVRVLTPEEIRHLPEDSGVVMIRGAEDLGYGVGEELVTGPNFATTRRGSDLRLYCALLSLPKTAEQNAITEARNEIHLAEAMLKRAKDKLDRAKLDGAF